MAKGDCREEMKTNTKYVNITLLCGSIWEPSEMKHTARIAQREKALPFGVIRNIFNRRQFYPTVVARH